MTGSSAWCRTARARPGDAHEESDYDVAVFLRDMPDRIAELYRLADLSTKIIVEEDGPFIHAGLSGRLLQRSAHAAHVCHPRRRY